jgi:hypothetical protein
MKKGQSLIIQFILFFIIGFTVFVTIGSFFKSQSEAFRSESTEYNLKLANSYFSSFGISLVDACKNCDYANVLIKIENTTAGYFFEENLNNQGLSISAPNTDKSFASSVHNLNSSTTFAGKSSSAKTISLTFNRSQNVLYLGELGITPSPTTTTSSTTTSSTTTLPPPAKSPIWQNQGTNDTDNSILQGQAINLTAQGKDDTALDWAWLSTNETGIWKNYTQITSQTISDSFTDETKIAVKANVTVNTTLNQVNLNASGIDSYTKLMLHMNGADGSKTFTDSEIPPTKTVTPYGDAEIDTAQSKFGGASGLFDGTGDYLSALDSADWAFGTDNFTIDFWVKFATLPTAGNRQYIFSQYVDANNRQGLNLYNQAGTYYWQYTVFSGGVMILGTSGTPSSLLDIWQHIALVRNGNDWRIYQNGTSVTVGTSTDADAVPDFASVLYIGQGGDGTGYLNGWLDELRISKGVARWTSSFTPPTREYGNYYSSGQLWSTNLLSGQSVSSITSFGYNVSSIPSGTTLQVQFSQDNSTWKNSAGTTNGWDTLTQGANKISLSSLGWSGANFYYKIQFSSDGTNTPVVDDINVTYSQSFYNSPMNMTKDSNWQWSNFTWSNSSVPLNTVVGWRIYYNDTSGNQNVTDIMTFTVG